jgi:TRAP-type C4-dicarboxylate transport system permease small subunit
MTVLRSLDRFLYRVEYWLLVIFLSAMVVLAFGQVVLRNFFDTGIFWGDPVIRHLVLWVGFIGAALATSDERHISIDALSKFLSPRLGHASRIITSLFALVICYYLADAALTFLLDEKVGGGEVFLSIPTWYVLIIIPSGYAIIAFHFLVRGAQSILGVLGKGEPR